MTWQLPNKERWSVIYKDVLYICLLYFYTFVSCNLDRQLMGLAANNNNKWKHARALTVWIICFIVPIFIVIASTHISCYSPIDIYIIYARVCNSIFVSIGNYLLLTNQSHLWFNINTDEKISELQTLKFKFSVVCGFGLSLNGIYEIVFKRFSLNKMILALGCGMLSIDEANKIQNVEKMFKAIVSKIKLLPQFNFQSFTELRTRKYKGDEDYEENLFQTQIEFEEAQNEM